MSKLFKFPIVMIDARKEDSSRSLGLTALDSTDSEYIIGEAELPAEDFVGVLDRWLPSTESYEKAQEGEFEACFVIFAHSGSWTCAWNKDKFKRKMEDFLKKETVPDVQTLLLNQKQIEYIMSIKDDDKKEENG